MDPIQAEINVLFPDVIGDGRRRKQRYIYTHLRMKGLPSKEALETMREQGMYP